MSHPTQVTWLLMLLLRCCFMLWTYHVILLGDSLWKVLSVYHTIIICVMFILAHEFIHLFDSFVCYFFVKTCCILCYIYYKFTSVPHVGSGQSPLSLDFPTFYYIF